MKTIEELARDAGLVVREFWGPESAGDKLFHTQHLTGITIEHMARLVELVRAQALEEAAKVCDFNASQAARPYLGYGPAEGVARWPAATIVVKGCAEDIRALKDAKP